MQPVAIIGVSGVGKSTLVKSLENKLPFLHLEASQLLKAEFARRSIGVPTSEDLRKGEVIDNQPLLVQSFRHATHDYDGIVFFDGHALIDGQEGIVEIPEAIFRELNIRKFVFIQAPPEDIAARRMSDAGRIRPRRDVSMLAEQQWRSLRLIAGYSMSMNVPLLVIDPRDHSSLIAFVSP